jgi:glycosyltransferase involved in cell wall biosynthesis
MRVPMVASDMMMDFTRVLPKSLPTTFGTPELVQRAKATGRSQVELLLPPVDVYRDAPGTVDAKAFRREYGISDEEIAIVTIGRLDINMKSESIYRTISAVRDLGRRIPLRYVVVGDGTARTEFQRRVHDANAELGREVVTWTGALLDPRPAYAAADIVIGMGGSALRAMAFEKPVIIAGEQGFSALFTPEAAKVFYYRGMYGSGDARTDSGSAVLASQIRELAENAEQRAQLGQFGRDFVVRDFSLEVVSTQLAAFCRQAVAQRPAIAVSAIDGIRTTAVYLRERKFRWHWQPEVAVRPSDGV